MDYSTRHEGDVTASTGVDPSNFQGEESLLDDAELTGSTPRPPATKTMKTQIASLDSPYENMKHGMKVEEGGETTVLEDEDDTSVLFAQRTARLPDMSMTPGVRLEGQAPGGQSAQKSKDPLLHRLLDKNYRIQATPRKPALRISPLKGKGKESTPAAPTWQDDSPMSSPEMAVPKLRSEAFMSPMKGNARQRLAAPSQNQGPRTPGVSVQTPATARKTRNAFEDEDTQGERYEIDWDIGEPVDEDDIDLYAGMSPPKTIQFALPPSKLLQTPGKSGL